MNVFSKAETMALRIREILSRVYMCAYMYAVEIIIRHCLNVHEATVGCQQQRGQ